MFSFDNSVENILNQQFQLAYQANISIETTEAMSNIDRELYYSLLAKQKKDEEKEMNSN